MSKKNLVKILSIIFTLIALSTCVVLAVSAAGTSVNVNDETAYRGGTVTFNATLSESIEVGSGSLAISYDPSVLELTGGSCNVSGAMLANFDVAKGKGAFAFSGTGTVSGNLFTATFRVKDTAAFATTDVSLTVTLKDGSNKIISLTNNDGSITVKCNHSFTKEDTTYLKSEATCTSPAVYYKSCAICGEKGTETFEHGATAEHSYTKQVTTDAYKKSSASCTAKAVYYFCCSTCEAKGNDTYEHGDILEHSYTREVITDTYKVSDADCDSKAVYNYCCATCDANGTTTFEHGEVLGHTGGAATCTAKAICTRCSQEYGDTLDHTYDQEVVQDAYFASAASCTAKAKYYKSCSCGAKGSVTFEVGEKKAHTNTQKVDDLYLKSAATCTAKAVYYESCSVCGAKGTATFEAGNAPGHNYKTTWSTNASSHWHECAKCGDKKDAASHTAGAAATESTAQTCTVCGYVITPALGHTHSYKSEWSNNTTDHWHACTGCGSTKDKAKHIYTNACDADCDVCGYTRTVTHTYKTEWSSDGEKHWYECSACGDKIGETTHTPGKEATETTSQVCTICGYVIKESLGHTHNHNTMKNDETNHWNECACGATADVAAHTWDDGVITKEATYDEEGEKTFICSICARTKVESVEKLIHDETTTNTDVDTDAPVDTDTPTGTEADSDVPMDTDTPIDTETDTNTTEKPAGGCCSTIGLGATYIVLIAIAFGVVMLSKRKEHNFL